MPFRMTFIQSPIGATISGEFDIAEDSIVSGTYVHTRPEDYGVVTWPNASGTGTFEVLIEDQSGATTTALWTVETDDTAFVYLDAVDGDDSNDGSFASPSNVS